MKNLRVSSSQSFEFDLQSKEETLLLSAFDIERNRVFFASSANILYSFQLPLPQEGKAWNKSLFSPQFAPISLEPGDFIAAMDYMMDKEAVVLGTSNGCLILHSMDLNTTEFFGKVEGGVTCISCSPDGALLSVTTGLEQLLVMTHDWEVLHETALNPKNDVGDAYGYYCSKFHSSISWRGDGKYFATLGGLNELSLKKLRIWEREAGMLHSETDAKDFMGAALDWMPSGAKVAAAYDRKSENECPCVVFFEKNGLERNYFLLDEALEISIIQWNCNSDLLGTSVSCDQYDAIKIWFFSNNHWYLKQEIRFSKRDAVKFMWNPTKPMHLICWTQAGRVITYNFVWITAITDDSTALVIDGSNLLVSPLTLSLMPPPLCLFTLKFHTAIQDVAFISKNSKNQLAACLSDGSLCILELPVIGTWEHFEDKVFGVVASSFSVTMGTIAHLMWLDSNILLGVCCNQFDLSSTISWSENDLNHQKLDCSQDYSLLEIVLACSEDSVSELVNSSGWRATLSNSLPLEAPVIGIVSNPCKKASAFVQSEGGSVFVYTSTACVPGGSQHCELSDYGFSASCSWMKAIGVCYSGTLKSLLFGLDYDGRLLVGRRILCSNCTSFTFYSSTCDGIEHITHLILTTKQDLLFIISIDDILNGNKEIQIYGDVHNGRDNDREYINLWERGAKLIGTFHGDEAAVILQANRGNLECIYPRKLVLISILNAIVQRRFKDALLMVRRHRIDFNFIIDCCGWQTFVRSAAEFVSQVNNLAHVTEFVSSIKNGNVMEKLYKDYISPPLPHETSNEIMENTSSFAGESKVNFVLRAIRKALEELLQESSARELCILTTLACHEPPALVEALHRIKFIREMELSGVNDAKRISYPSAEDSLKHLLWLTNAEAVFEAALGLYDVNLAAIVALNSQKDPKEFLPYLKELEVLSPVIMRYTIDLRLQRYESAIKHLFSAGESYHEECLNLMKNNPQLFPLGLQLFANNVKRKEILEAWGDHLHSEKKFQDAAAAYLCCSSLQKALKAYHDCGDWKEMFTVTRLMGLDKADILQLANELCEEFQALGKPLEAAMIALEYCQDVGRCVGYYTMAREWKEALRISLMYEREDLTSSVEVAALECAVALISDFKEASEKVGKYLARYVAVRQRRITLAAKIQSERLTEDADYDSVSEISSKFSEMSAYTSRTMKDSVTSTSSATVLSKASEKRKRNKGGKIRAGSPGEEMALVEHLKGMCLTVSSQSELKSLVVALLMMGKEETARQLLCAGDNFQLSQHSAVKLAEDTMSTDRIDEGSHTLDNYIKHLRASFQSQSLSWQFKVLRPN